MTRNEILPCPFCDNLDVTCYEGSTFRWIFAECDVCGARSGEVRKDTLSKDREAAQAKAELDAIAAWNTRPEAAQPVQPRQIKGMHKDLVNNLRELRCEMIRRHDDARALWVRSADLDALKDAIVALGAKE